MVFVVKKRIYTVTFRAEAVAYHVNLSLIKGHELLFQHDIAVFCKELLLLIRKTLCLLCSEPVGIFRQSSFPGLIQLAVFIFQLSRIQVKAVLVIFPVVKEPGRRFILFNGGSKAVADIIKGTPQYPSDYRGLLCPKYHNQRSHGKKNKPRHYDPNEVQYFPFSFFRFICLIHYQVTLCLTVYQLSLAVPEAAF